MPGSARSGSSKRSLSKRRRGPSSVKSDRSSSIWNRKRIRSDMNLRGKVLGYVQDLPSRSSDGIIVIRGFHDFRDSKLKDLADVEAYLRSSGKWPAPGDQETAVSAEFANIVDKDYRALGLKWKWPGRYSKIQGEVRTLDSSELDDLVLVDIEVCDGRGYAVNTENISANIRLSRPEDRTQGIRDLTSKLDDALEERSHLKARLNKAKRENHITMDDCVVEGKSLDDYENTGKRVRERYEKRKERAPKLIAKVEAQLDENWDTIKSLDRLLAQERGQEQHGSYAQTERVGRPRQRREEAAYEGYERVSHPQGYDRTASRSVPRRPTLPTRASSMFPGAYSGRDPIGQRSRPPLDPRGYSRMPSFAEWHASTPYYKPKFDEFDDETYFSRPVSRASSLSQSRSRSVSMRGDDFMRSWDRPRPRKRRPSIWSTDSFPPPRPFPQSRSQSFSSRRSFSMPRRPSYYGGPPPLSRMPSRSGSKGGGYRKYVNDTGSVISENSYTDHEGWRVKSFSRRKSFSGGAGNRSSMSFSTGIRFD